MNPNITLEANEGKHVERSVDGTTYNRYAIKTHFVKEGENLHEIIEKYIVPIYKEGDILSISEKIVALCQRDVIYKKDLKVGLLARFLSKFVVKNKHCYGLRNVYKMQAVIDIVGPFKVIMAAIVAVFGKLIGKKGVFYEFLGNGVANIDGFGDEGFEYYSDMGTLAPSNPEKACQSIKDTFGINTMIVDANDLGVEILGTDKELSGLTGHLKNIILDNPAGQEKQQTPLILIRPVRDQRRTTA